jgi:hypothetical protein
MAEVADVRPGAPGWGVVLWKPRVALFPDFDGCVPLGGRLAPAVAHVSWRREGEREGEGEGEGQSPRCISLALELRHIKDEAVPIRIELPDGRVEEVRGSRVSLQICM